MLLPTMAKTKLIRIIDQCAMAGPLAKHASRCGASMSNLDVFWLPKERMRYKNVAKCQQGKTDYHT